MADKKTSGSRVRRRSARQWKSLCRRANIWKKISPGDSFVMLYLKKKRVVWEGSKHMKGFVENPDVIKGFKQCVDRQMLTTVAVQQHEAKPLITMPSEDVEQLSVEFLQAAIPIILNPSNIYGFYKTDNQPSWWPNEICFQSPNHPKEGRKLSASKLRRIMSCYLQNNPGTYRLSVSSANSNSEQSEQADGTSTEVADSSANSNSEQSEQADGTSTEVADSNHEEQTVSTLMKLEDNLGTLHILSETNGIIDERYGHHHCLPAGMVACQSTAYGNCLFCSVSLVLYGNEEMASDLRRAAVQHASDHFDHYLDQFDCEAQSDDDAIAFCNCVSGDVEIPDDLEKRELIAYTMRKEIDVMAKDGEYSGVLQIIFLSGLLNRPIQQHCMDPLPMYQARLGPCPCQVDDLDKDPCHIMWVKSYGEDKTSQRINHIIPVIRIASRRSRRNTKCLPSQNAVKITRDICHAAFWSMCIGEWEETTFQGWIQCSKCHHWFHSICTGIKSNTLGSDHFICCPKNDDVPDIRIVQFLSYADVLSLQLDNGISDGIVQYYMSKLSSSNCVTLLPPVFSQIIQACKSLNEKMKSHKRHWKTEIKEVIILPIRTEQWHWIAVLLNLKTQRIYFIDSLPQTHDAYEELHNKIRSYFGTLLKIKTDWIQGHAQVPLQSGVNCGLNMLHNIELLLKDNTQMYGQQIHITKSTDAVQFRKILLRMIYEEQS